MLIWFAGGFAGYVRCVNGGGINCGEMGEWWYGILGRQPVERWAE